MRALQRLRTTQRAALIVACLLSLQTNARADVATLQDGKATPLCRALRNVLSATLKTSSARLCALPVDSAAGIQRLNWTPVEAPRELEAIKLIFAWNALRQPEFRSQSYLDEIRHPGFLSSSAVEANWNARSGNVYDLITSGKLTLEEATVALSGGAVLTNVYRVNQLYPSGKSSTGQPIWSLWSCNSGHGAALVPEFDYFFAPREQHWDEFRQLNFAPYSPADDLILWDGEVYRSSIVNEHRTVLIHQYQGGASVDDDVYQDATQPFCRIEISN